jgi:2-C-methyl-D-erythritol 2,4-cyclodiphosphate synthase
MVRVGLGWDRHRLVEGRPLLLGGVEVPFSKGEAAHSDGDVLLHALIDALLGAAALGDIGERYPDTDPRWKDADSRALLRRAWAEVRDAGWCLANLDCVVLLEAPKVLPHREAIRASLAALLDVPIDRVFLKGKTGEGVGEVGRGEVVEAWVTCLLEK